MLGIQKRIFSLFLFGLANDFHLRPENHQRFYRRFSRSDDAFYQRARAIPLSHKQNRNPSEKHQYQEMRNVTPPKTKEFSRRKGPFQKDIFIFQPLIFREFFVSFRRSRVGTFSITTIMAMLGSASSKTLRGS